MIEYIAQLAQLVQVLLYGVLGFAATYIFARAVCVAYFRTKYEFLRQYEERKKGTT